MTVPATTPAKTPTATKAPAKAPAKAAAKPATRRVSSKNAGATLPENHTAAEAIAHAITTLHIDLAPSVNRIMSAELEEPSRLVAITLFRDSLDIPGDQYRFPANAIEGGRLMVAIPAAE